jgi:hypothetical protein
MDGSYFFYHVRDKDEDLWLDPFIKKMQAERTVPLPAIYDMTPSGTRIIRCPFYRTVSPMTTVVFQNRFTIGSMVNFFYPVKTNAFLVVTAQVTFNTTTDENMMELTCVDLPSKEVDIKEDTGELYVKPSDHVEKSNITALQEQRNMEWTEQSLTVVLHKTNVTETDSRWENIVNNDVVVLPERWPEGQVITEIMKLESLKEWNPDYFDDGKQYIARGNSIENDPAGIGGRTGIKVPWLKEGDVIVVRYPFQPEYPEDQKVVI